jgi:hypothetical protein
MKRIATFVMSLALFIGCGLPEQSGQEDARDLPLNMMQENLSGSANTPIKAVPSRADRGAGHEQMTPLLVPPSGAEDSAEGSLPQATGTTVGNAGGDATARSFCCYAECYDGREHWYYVGAPPYGQCRDRAQEYCAGRGMGYKGADWRPCP